MAGTNSEVSDIKKLDGIMKNMKTHLNAFAKSTQTALTTIQTMEKGDGQNPYWTGEAAYKWTVQMYNHIGQLVSVAYQNNEIAYRKMAKFTADTRNRDKGKSGKVQASEYTNGLTKTESLWQPAPNNVAEDRFLNKAGNINKQQASKFYDQLLQDLLNVQNCEAKIAKDWDEIAKITKGSAQKRAKKRSAGLYKRQARMTKFITAVFDYKLSSRIMDDFEDIEVDENYESSKEFTGM